jgi:hypothetical protein
MLNRVLEQVRNQIPADNKAPVGYRMARLAEIY